MLSLSNLWGIPLLSNLLFFMAFTKWPIAKEKYLMLTSKGAGGRVLFYYENNNSLPRLGTGRCFMGMIFIWVSLFYYYDLRFAMTRWYSFWNDSHTQIYYRLFVDLFRAKLSFWNDWPTSHFVMISSLSFWDDFMPFILKWVMDLLFDMTTDF